MLKFIVKGSIPEADVIEITGSLIEKNLNEAKEHFTKRLDHGIGNIILLCKNFEQIDSSGVSLLTEVSYELEERKGKLFFVDCPSPIVVLIQSLDFDNIFQFHRSEKEVYDALGITPEDFLFSATGRALKRQITIKDHIRNKMILFQHNQSASVHDIIDYLKSNYAHFRRKQISLSIDGKVIDPDSTIADLFNTYNYSPNNMLEIREKENFPILEDEAGEKEKPSSEGKTTARILEELAESGRDDLAGERTVVDDVAPEQENFSQVDISNDLSYKNEFELVITEALQNVVQDTLSVIHRAERTMNLMLALYKSFHREKTLKHALITLIDAIFTLEPFEAGVVLLYERETGELKCQHFKHKFDETREKVRISQKVLRQLETNRKLILALPAQTEEIHLAIPILSGKQMMGVTYLIMPKGKKSLSKQSLQTISAVISYSAMAIENSILIQETEKLLSRGN